MSKENDPLDPTSVEAVARDVARDLYTAESACGFNETETLISMHLGKNYGGLSGSALAREISRSRKTVSQRLEMMAKEGLVHRKGNVWRLTDKGMRQREARFHAIWEHLPQTTKDIFRRESERRRAARPQE